MPDEPYLPMALLQTKDVYKRASKSAQHQIRKATIRAQAAMMPEKVEKTILAAVQQHPNMSPGTIIALAEASQGLMDVKDNILSQTNESVNEWLAFQDVGLADSRSQALESSYGETKDAPLPQTPDGNLPVPEDDVPDPEEDSEGALDWLGQNFPVNSLTNAVATLFPGVAATPALFSAATDTDNPLANKLTETIGSPSAENPDPSLASYVGPSAPRMFFGNVMNLMMTGIDMYNAQGRQYAGKYAKAYAVARRNGIQVDNVHDLEQIFPDLADDGEGVLDKVYTLRAIPGLSKLRDDMLLAGVKDESIPVGTGSVEKAQREFADYRANVQADGGIWNSVDIYRNFKAGTLAQTPWFGGEANNRDGVLGKEEYAGTVYDVRTWDEKQAIAKAIAARKAVWEALGVEANIDEIERMTAPRPWTQGRALAGQVTHDPQSMAYKTLSGVIDFGIALGADPLTYVPGAAITKPGKAALRGLSKAAPGKKVLFESDVLMDKAKKGWVQHIRSLYDEAGVSDTPAPKFRWVPDREVRGTGTKRTVQWVEDGDSLKPTTGGTRVKGATVKTVETREMNGGTMFRRGSGWAVRQEDGTALQFPTITAARDFLRQSGAKGKTVAGSRTALFDDAGRVTFHNSADEAKQVAMGTTLKDFTPEVTRTRVSPQKYEFRQGDRVQQAVYNRATKVWDVMEDGKVLSSHRTLKEAEAAGFSPGAYKAPGTVGSAKISFGPTAHNLINEEDGSIVARAIAKDGKVQVGDKTFDTWDDAARAFAEPHEVARDRIGVAETVKWMTQTKHGQDTVQALIDADSATRIFQRSHGKIDMDTARLLQDAENFDQVARILESRIGVSITDPKAIRSFTGLNAKMYNAKLKWAGGNKFEKAMYRAGQMAHNTNFIDLNDADDIAEQSLRLTAELGVDPDTSYKYIDEMISLKSATERRDFFQDTFIPLVVDRHLQKLGVKDVRRAELVRSFRKQNLEARKRLSEIDDAIRRTDVNEREVMRDASGGQAAMGTQGPGLYLDEFGDESSAFAILSQRQHMALPSVRELRRELNVVARALRKNQSPLKETDAFDTVAKGMSAFLDGWRSLTLMNGAYIMRNIGEEALRASFLGNTSLLNNPVGYLALLQTVYSAQAGNVLFKRFFKHARRARKMAGMAEKLRYNPEAYRGTALVDAKALLPLVTKTISNETKMRNAHKRTRTAAQVGKDVAKHGIIDPIDVVFDPATGRYGIADGQKRVLLAAQHGVDVPVRVRPGPLPGYRGDSPVRVRAAKPPENAPHFTSASGSVYTLTPEGKWARVQSVQNATVLGNAGKTHQPFEFTMFLPEAEASNVQLAMELGRFRVTKEGKLVGVEFGGNPDKSVVFDLVQNKKLPRDEAWERAGGTVRNVEYAAQEKPRPGLNPVEWNADGKWHVGSKITGVNARKKAFSSNHFGPGGLMFHISPKRNRNLIEQQGLRRGKDGRVNLSEQPLKFGDEDDVWIVETRDMPLEPDTASAMDRGVNSHFLSDDDVSKRRVRLATDEERQQIADALSEPTWVNPLAAEKVTADTGDEALKTIADIDQRIEDVQAQIARSEERMQAEPEMYGLPMPGGWQQGDVTAETLFGDGVIGGTEDVMRQAVEALDDYLGYRRAMRFIHPYWRHNAARITGAKMYQDMENVAQYGDESFVSQIARQATLMHGQNYMDENPQQVFKEGLKQVTFAEKPDAYIELLAENIEDLLRSREVRDFLGGKATVDGLVNAIFNDPKRVADIYAGMDIARVAAAKARKIEPKWGDEVTIKDVVKMQDIDENVAKEQVRNLIVWQIEQATAFMGKGTSRGVWDAISKGSYKGAPLGPKNNDFKRLLRAELEHNEQFRESLPMLIDGIGHASRKKNFNSLATAFFEQAGNVRDLLTLHPLMREEYVDEVTRLVRFMSEKDKQQIIKNLDLAGDSPLAKKILSQKSAGKEGILDISQAERLADKHARKVAKEKFYDAAERRNWAVAFRWAGPFMQAAANSTYVWGKAFTTRTPDVYRTIRSINAIKDFDLDPIYSMSGLDTESNQALGMDGAFYRDGYGEERFLLPGIGILAGLLPLTDTPSAATQNTNSIDLFQDGLLGSAGPLLQFSASMLVPDAQGRADIIGDVTRFVQKYPLPQGSTTDKIVQSFTPVKWRNLLIDGPRETDLVQSVLASRMQSGKYGDPSTWDQSQWENVRAEVQNDVGWLIKLETAGKLLFPTLGSWQFEPLGSIQQSDVHPGMGTNDVLMSQLSKEYRKYVGDTTGEDRRKRVAAFLEMYGEFAAVDTLGSKESNNLPESVGDSTQYAYENRKLYDSWRGAMAWMMPQGDYETQWTQKEQFLRQRSEGKGWTSRRSAWEQLDFVRQYMLDAGYRSTMQKAEQHGLDAAARQQITDKFRKAGMDQSFDAYTEEQMANIESMMFSKDAAEIVQTVPAAAAVRKYLLYRKEVQDRLADEFDSRSLSSSQALESDAGVVALFKAGEAQAARDPGFRRFWSLAQREYGEDNADAIRGADETWR